VSPGVALLNYISCGILWRIFCQTGIFAGFSLHSINNAVRISETAAMGGAGDILLIKKNETKQKLERMVAPVYTLILTPNG
jgi:hypothetical protein